MKRSDKPPALTPREELVLRILLTGELYGLQIESASEGVVGKGAVYVMLSRLCFKGLIMRRPESAELASDHGGTPRPLYRVSALGRRKVSEAAAWRKRWFS